MEYKFVETDTEKLKQNIINGYETLAGRTLAMGDPIRLFLESQASLIVEQRVLIDHLLRMNMLAFAKGVYLDVLGQLVGTDRLPASAAVTTMRFTLSAKQPGAVIIPKGTRITGSGSIIFETTELAQIAPGKLTIDVTAVCQTSGDVGNGYLPREIKTLIDPIPFVASVENTSTTAGGADVEDDESYRGRIEAAPGQFSVAGPNDAYIYWAKTAHVSVSDISVESPAGHEGEVHIYVLMKGGKPATEEIIKAVNDTCNDKRIRPLTDRVMVKPPTQVSYNIRGSFYISSADASRSTTIQADVQNAVNEYVSWQKDKLGRDINPSELIRRIMQAGAKRVELQEPVFKVLQNSQVAAEGTVSLTLGGIEDA